MSDELHNYTKTGIVQSSDNIVTRLRELGRYVNTEGGRWFEPITTEAADEIERLRTALQTAVGELSATPKYKNAHPEQLLNQLLEQAVRGG